MAGRNMDIKIWLLAYVVDKSLGKQNEIFQRRTGIHLYFCKIPPYLPGNINVIKERRQCHLKTFQQINKRGGFDIKLCLKTRVLRKISRLSLQGNDR